MIDLYLRAETKTQMDAALARAGLMDRSQVNAIDENGEESERFEYAPKPGVCLDVIGPISRVIGYDDAGEPITQNYPEWHVNVRANLSDEQIEALSAVTIVPPEVPYRVWA